MPVARRLSISLSFFLLQARTEQLQITTMDRGAVNESFTSYIVDYSPFKIFFVVRSERSRRLHNTRFRFRLGRLGKKRDSENLLCPATVIATGSVGVLGNLCSSDSDFESDSAGGWPGRVGSRAWLSARGSDTCPGPVRA
jgi:hypothetical protein